MRTSFGLLALIQYDVASAQAFCHCSATCVQNCMGLTAAVCKASAFAQVPAGLTLGKDFNFDSIADGELVIGDLICSSQASIRCSITWICMLVILCSCARVASTICSGHPSARAASASFSMTCSLFFSLLLAVSMRQVDIASKAAFTALRASSESPGTDIELKLRGFIPADLFCMAASPLTDRNDPLGGSLVEIPAYDEDITTAILSHRRDRG